MGIIGKTIIKHVAGAAAMATAKHSLHKQQKKNSETNTIVFPYTLHLRGNTVSDNNSNKVYKVRWNGITHTTSFLDKDGNTAASARAHKTFILKTIEVEITVDGISYVVDIYTSMKEKYGVSGLGLNIETSDFWRSNYIVTDRNGQQVIRFGEVADSNMVIEYIDPQYEHIALALSQIHKAYSSINN